MKFKNICLAIAMGFSIVSCDLAEDDSLILTSNDFYKTEEQCMGVLNSCYIPLKSLYTGDMFVMTEGVTDIASLSNGTGNLNGKLDLSPTKPLFGSTVWEKGYLGVRYCNDAIDGFEKSELPDDTKAPLIAEAKVMRAFYYWLLTSVFGDVPFYTESIVDAETLDKITKLPRMSAVDTRNWLIEDLQGCLNDLEHIRTYEINGNRAGAMLGYTLIAKMGLWNKKWDIVIDACENVREVYGDLSQYPLSDIPFSQKNTPESIFEIQHSYTAGGLDYTSNVASYCMPYPRKDGDHYDGVRIPELGDQASAYIPNRVLRNFIYVTYAKERQDYRRDMTFVEGWDCGDGEGFKNFSTYHTGKNSSWAWLGPKFWCYGMQSNNDSNNYKVFRYAGVLLMAAEAYCMRQQSNEDMEKAIECLNQIKHRAYPPETIGFTNCYEYNGGKSFARVLEEVKNECARELFGEFNRKFDLVRWGTWYSSIKAIIDDPDIAKQINMYVRQNIQPCHEYYPIPAVQVSYSGNALDNNAYSACGL